MKSHHFRVGGLKTDGKEMRLTPGEFPLLTGRISLYIHYMIRFRICLLICNFGMLPIFFPSGGEVSAQVGQSRTWTDSSGRKVTAELEGFQDENTVLFKLPNGSAVPFPIAKLSPPDAEFAKKAYEIQSKNANIDWENPKESENYVIRSVSRERAPGYVSTKSGWEWQIKCLQVRVEFRGPRAVAPGQIKAYFYNRDGKLLEKFNEPPRRQNEDETYIDAPKDFQQNETVEVFFPLTEFLEKGDWATALIVFGADSDFSVKATPGTSLEPFVFAEKKYVFPGWEPSQAAPGNKKGAVTEADLEIRRFREDTHEYSLFFNGSYRENMPCMTAEVRVVGDINPAEGKVKLYAFDPEGRLVVTRNKPSTARIDGDGSYVSNPKIADGSWYPVFFSLDQDLAGKDFPTYVLYFEFRGKAAAAVESSVGATIGSLDFPGRKKLPQ